MKSCRQCGAAEDKFLYFANEARLTCTGCGAVQQESLTATGYDDSTRTGIDYHAEHAGSTLATSFTAALKRGAGTPSADGRYKRSRGALMQTINRSDDPHLRRSDRGEQIVAELCSAMRFHEHIESVAKYLVNTVERDVAERANSERSRERETRESDAARACMTTAAYNAWSDARETELQQAQTTNAATAPQNARYSTATRAVACVVVACRRNNMVIALSDLLERASTIVGAIATQRVNAFLVHMDAYVTVDYQNAVDAYQDRMGWTTGATYRYCVLARNIVNLIVERNVIKGENPLAFVAAALVVSSVVKHRDDTNTPLKLTDDIVTSVHQALASPVHPPALSRALDVVLRKWGVLRDEHPNTGHAFSDAAILSVDGPALLASFNAEKTVVRRRKR